MHAFTITNEHDDNRSNDMLVATCKCGWTDSRTSHKRSNLFASAKLHAAAMRKGA